MKYSISQIADMIGVRLPHASGRCIDTLLTDSRSLSRPESSLFFAIHTASNDGHKYIRDLYERGVRAFVTDHWDPQWRDMDADFIISPNGALDAMQRFIGAHRRLLTNSRIIGITGSRGKTTLKEWLNTLISPDMKVTRSPRSYNSQIGVPLSLWRIGNDTEIALIEAGISRPGEMSRLATIIDPDIVVITNIHDDHADSFSSAEEKCAEKLLLARGASFIICSADDPIVYSALKQMSSNSHHLFTWSLSDNPEARLNFRLKKTADNRLSLTVEDASGHTAVTMIGNDDPVYIENVCHSAAVMASLGYEASIIADRTSKLAPVNTRTDVVEGTQGSLIIRDRYDTDADSLGPALDFMKRRVTDPALTTVILDLPERSTYQPDQFVEMASELSARNIQTLIMIGNCPEKLSAIMSEAVPSVISFESLSSLITAIDRLKEITAGHIVLIKGSDSSLDSVAEALQARRHETRLEVNLDALVDNYNFYRRQLKDQHTGIVCMIKASGYGAGSYELARTLQSQGAAYLAVAVLDEGTELRRAGITMPIMVLNPRVVNYDELFSSHLEPEIFSFDELEAIVAAARRRGISQYPVHIKLDTGMHRLGFIGDEIPELIRKLNEQNEVRPVTVFSHLAAADEPALDDFTREQLSAFEKWSKILRDEWPDIKRHILNSTGITRFPEGQYELVRLGICLYGVSTLDDGSQADLRPVSSLSTSVIALRDWPAGTTIGYGRRGVCCYPTRVATIPVGYADGINRHLGNGAMQVAINGHRCPTIGNICMDACMIDVTACGDDVRVGDRVEIFGKNIPVTELSDTLGTIPYEILTSVSTRVKRVYYRE